MNLTFIIIEYHCLDEIGQCLAALRSNSGGLSFEILVSSNSAYDADRQRQIQADHPEANWLFNGRNGGFAYAMNRGMEQAAGDVIVVLNPDARLKSGIKPAVDFLLSDDKTAVVGPKTVDSQGRLQDTARCFMTPWGLLARSLKRIVKRQAVLFEKSIDYQRTHAVDWVIGAFMMVRKCALEKVGMLDEGYFLYVEDMDWCMRFWQAGFKVFYYPGLLVEYRGTRKSISPLLRGEAPEASTGHHLRSYLRFLIRHKFFVYRDLKKNV